MVIAATALISAVNAVTLKPAQCALWLRPSGDLRERAPIFRLFEHGYLACERAYTRLISRLVARHRLVFALTIVLVGLSGLALDRIPTSFLPVEDQGYLLASVQLPDGASLARTTRALEEVTRRAKAVPGVDKVVAIAGLSALNDNASLANAGVAYVMLSDWKARRPGEDLPGLYAALSKALAGLDDGAALVLPPPPIQGIGNASGFTMKVELRDGSFDYQKLQRLADGIAERAREQNLFQAARNTFSAQAPQVEAVIDRTKAETLGISFGTASDALGAYVGSALLQELQHRIANNLQLIASILLLKARAVSSEETRQHLKDAHQRVMSVAEVQRHLHVSEGIDQIEVGSYLTKLCGSLAALMIGENQPVTVEVMADMGNIRSEQAVSLGLIVTELVINAIKHAFPVTKAGAQIRITYEINGADWKLTVSDNGIGKSGGEAAGNTKGLGMAIVQALVKQLGAVIDAADRHGGHEDFDHQGEFYPANVKRGLKPLAGCPGAEQAGMRQLAASNDC